MGHRFAHKVALVTGAGSGVGRASALCLAREGAAVALVGRRTGALESVADEVRGLGGRTACIPADVSAEDQMTLAARAAAEQLGRIDLLVNAAGVLRLGPAVSFATRDWDTLFDVNAKGCFLASRAVIPLMRPRGGAIVNVSSVFALASGEGAAAYAASKAAVVALTRAMALEHVKENIRINAVAPGSMATPMLQAVADVASPGNPAAMLEAVARLHPTRRLVEPDEVAQVIAFLLSDVAGSIVGSTIVVDGGRLARLGSGD